MKHYQTVDVATLRPGVIQPFNPANWDGESFRKAALMREARLAYRRDLCIGKSRRCLVLGSRLSLAIVADGDPDPEPCISLGPQPPPFPLLYPAALTAKKPDGPDDLKDSCLGGLEAKLNLLQRRISPSLMQWLAEMGMETGHPEIAVLVDHFPLFARILASDPQLGLLYALHHYTGHPGSRSFMETGEQILDGPVAVARALDLPWNARNRKLLHCLCVHALPDRHALRRLMLLPRAAAYLVGLQRALPAEVIELVAGWKSLPPKTKLNGLMAEALSEGLPFWGRWPLPMEGCHGARSV